MPRIPKYTQQVTPSGRPTAATISPSVAETGAGAIGAAVQSIAQPIFNLGVEFQAAEDRTALIKLERDRDATENRASGTEETNIKRGRERERERERRERERDTERPRERDTDK